MIFHILAILYNKVIFANCISVVIKKLSLFVFIYDSCINCVLLCFRYRDFRNPPGHPNQYEYSIYYWHVIAAKLAFMIVVEVSD